MTIPQFSMIVAAASNRGIGKGGKIPWRIPEDLRYFRNVTCFFRDIQAINKFEISLNRAKRQRTEIETENVKSSVTANVSIKPADNLPLNVVVMGRNTWESIPEKFRPMPNRINVILSRNKEYSKNLPKDVQCYTSLNDCLENLSKQEHGTIFLIGGGQIYNEGIKHPSCESIFITKIHGKYECDTYFPEIPDTFKLNDDETVTKMLAHSMKNFEWVKGVQTNAKSGVKFEFQVYTRFHQKLSPITTKNLKTPVSDTTSATSSSSPAPSSSPSLSPSTLSTLSSVPSLSPVSTLSDNLGSPVYTELPVPTEAVRII